MDCQTCIWEGVAGPELACHLAGTPHQCALKQLTERYPIAASAQGSHADFHDFRLGTALQPIYSIAHERVVAYEALLRGQRGDERVSPWEVFSRSNDLAETVALDRLSRTVHLRNFHQHVDEPVWLFLNVNPEVMTHGRRFGSFFQELLQSTGVPPGQIVIEILEHAIEDETLLAETVAYYRQMGCLIALDDFGAGHSNFDRIIRLQPDIVKLDASMLRQASQHRSARRILPNLIAMLHEAGCLVLMEGIETMPEALLALDANVDFVQGFYFARPATPAQRPPSQKLLFEQLNQHYRKQFEQRSHARRQALEHYRELFLRCANRIEAGMAVEIACHQLMTQPRVQRAFLLDAHGNQIGDTLYPAKGGNVVDLRFLPLHDTRGANWNRKPYFRHAIVHPGKVKVTRPYFSISGVEMCITLSICIEVDEELRVLCCDLEFDEEDAAAHAEEQRQAFLATSDYFLSGSGR